MRRLILLFLLAAMVAPAGAYGSTLNATPATLSAQLSAAKADDTLLLATGNYGTRDLGSRQGAITLKPAPGATATINPRFWSAVGYRFDGFTGASAISGLYVASGSKNIAVVNSRFTGQAQVGDGSSFTNANILFDNDTFNNIDACGSCYEGRLTVRGTGSTAAQPMGVAVTNSHFGNAGESDGVQIIGAATGVKIGPGNEFSGIKQGSYSRHVDSIQLYGSSQTQIVGNYFHDNDTIIMAPDGGDRENVSNNVMIGSGYVSAVQFGHHNGTTFTHNTVKNLDVQSYVSGADSSPNRNIILRDNVLIGASLNTSGCQNCTTSYNLTNGGSGGTNGQTGTPVFVGGTNPTTYSGWALKDGSPGKANASDGTDRGINVSGGTPVDPPPDPPADTTPPDTVISNGPVDTEATSATVAFSSEPAATFQCRLDQGAWAACASPKQYTALAVGDHSIDVRAIDLAGNVDPSPARATWKVLAPTPPPDPCAQTKAERDQALADLAESRSELAGVKSDLEAMTASRDSVQKIADAYKTRAEQAEATVAEIHELSAP